MKFLDALFGKKVTIQGRDETGKPFETKISEKQFRKLEASGQISQVAAIVAHILDPNSGYTKQIWQVGKDIDVDTVKRLGENGEVFVLVSYEQGQRSSAICKRAIWLQAKALLDESERAWKESTKRTRDALKKLR